MSDIPKVQVLSRSRSALLNPAIILELYKFRLNMMVVISSLLGYFIGLQSFDIVVMISLMLGGFLVTGASNGMNQIIERSLDLKMERTKEKKNQRWAEKHGPTIFGLGVFAMLGLVAVFMRLYS